MTGNPVFAVFEVPTWSLAPIKCLSSADRGQNSLITFEQRTNPIDESLILRFLFCGLGILHISPVLTFGHWY